MNRTPEGNDPVSQQLFSDIERYSGAARELLDRIYEQVLATSSLDPRTVLLRMRWLLDRRADDPGDRHKIDLLGRKPPLDVPEIAKRVLHPRLTVFEVIESSSTVRREKLQAIYDARLSAATGSTGLPDLSEERMLQELKWWVLDLDFPDYYFDTTPSDEIARHILVNRFHEIQGVDSESYRNMKISYTSPGGTVMHWVHRGAKFLEIEQSIEQDFYRGGESHDVAVYAHGELFLYIVQKNPVPANADDFMAVAPRAFLQRNRGERRERYEWAWQAVRSSGSFYLEHSRKESTGEFRIVVGFPSRVINQFMANLSRVMIRERIDVKRKYAVAFGGAYPMILSSFYAMEPFPKDLLQRMVDIGLYPNTPLARLTEQGVISPAETNFIHAAIGFVHSFIRVKDPNIVYLEERFPDHAGLNDLFVSVKRRLAKDNFPVEKIAQAFITNPESARRLYALFRAKLDPAESSGASAIAGPAAFSEAVERFSAELEQTVTAHDDREIFSCALLFVRHVERTNFFLPVKTAMSFRLSPDFLAGTDFVRVPYAVFYVRGRDFTGFHVRFGNIARGGLRMLRSSSFDSYRANANTLFEECYNLADTQDRKNKDIPEKGAKGVILANFGRDDEAGRGDAFRKYIDALLDVLLTSNAPFIKGHVEELLFFGPDEGTAHLMDWACERARDRGYPFWRALTTGRSGRLGGISHLDYGMTTNGIRRYVRGICDRLGVREDDITKIQTGGPDGDLGGNEILLSRDKTVAVVDGGGVLYDPDGLDRDALNALARSHRDSRSFDRTKLGPRGFLITVDDRNVKTPDGAEVLSGLTFRNGFHLSRWMRADLFVPCGGRPHSIESTNWEQLLDDNGNPRVRWIVEGANLFISEAARLKLEEKGVILFKDASTNKGGVTSSAYEVLAGLALSDEEYGRLMCTGDLRNVDPPFRRQYIDQVIDAIRKNADAEFTLLWDTHARTGTPFTLLSDRLSARIMELTEEIESSQLFEETELVAHVLALHAPAVLVAEVGVHGLLDRLPRQYLRAIFARTVARLFVYARGIEPSYEEYRRFIEQLRGDTGRTH